MLVRVAVTRKKLLLDAWTALFCLIVLHLRNYCAWTDHNCLRNHCSAAVFLSLLPGAKRNKCCITRLVPVKICSIIIKGSFAAFAEMSCRRNNGLQGKWRRLIQALLHL